MLSASASSSSSTPSKADRIKQRAAQKDAEEKRAAAQAAFEKQMEEINAGVSGMGMMSTMEKSLDRALDAAADLEAFEMAEAAFKAKHPGSKADLWYTPEDQMTEEFWVHGVVEPDDPDDSTVAKVWKTNAKEWKKAFLQLEVQFIRRAVLAKDLKCVYEKQRQVRKVAERRASESSAAAAFSEKKVAKVIAASASILAIAEKPCKCATHCDSRSCGCKKADKSCSDKCGCKMDCCNPSSYLNTEEGEAECAAAIARYNKIQKAKANSAIQSKEKRIADIMALRAENGHD